MEKLTYTLEDLRGVGRVELELRPKERAYVFFGVNGVGKTKILEGLFQYWLFSNQIFWDEFYKNYGELFQIEENLRKLLVASISNEQFGKMPDDFSDGSIADLIPEMKDVDGYLVFEEIPAKQKKIKHYFPIVFLGAGKRGHIETTEELKDELFGTFESRRKKHFEYLINGMKSNFSNLGMDMGVEQLIVSIARSSNSFQKSKDNRSIEIKVLLQLLHQVDEKFDKEFIEIDGDGRIFLKINGIETDIRHLSTGFTSLLKIFQTIISGYGFFTNSTDLANVEGIVFIDEIESHLHVEWQSKIIPLLKKLFPNTTFFIATHSPIVLSQLEEGEAYRLEKQADGVVRATIIEAPNKRILSDVLVDAMDVDLNALKRKRLVTEDQTEAKKGLLALLRASKAARQKEPA